MIVLIHIYNEKTCYTEFHNYSGLWEEAPPHTSPDCCHHFILPPFHPGSLARILYSTRLASKINVSKKIAKKVNH